MIYAIDGILEQVNKDTVVVKAGPISFILNVSGTTINKLGSIGKNVSLFTYLYFREENIALYGFASEGELRLFQKLIGVGGIGPRVALGLLSAYEAEQLISAIVSNNMDLLSQVSGVGKKTAARIILELKSKLEKEDIGVFTASISEANADLISALTGLGYSVREANQVVSSIPDSPDLTLEEKVKLALQNLAAK
jgi:Holliday junction DNA helicase RuvA